MAGEAAARLRFQPGAVTPSPAPVPSSRSGLVELRWADGGPYHVQMDLGTELRLAIERVLRRYLAGMVGRVAFGVLGIILIPLVTVLALAVFALLAVVIFGGWALLGQPEQLAPVVGTSWIVGSLVIVALVLLRGHRWLARLLRIADAPARLIDPALRTDPTTVAPDPIPSPIVRPSETFEKRLAAADARHAPDRTIIPPGDRVP